MTRTLHILLFLATVAVLAGCASSNPNQVNNEGNQSSLPWNRPASWEGQGQLGGLGGGGR
jgi:outer membrane biogenesis lipoprotein LolB